jgi:hypothetical protein
LGFVSHFNGTYKLFNLFLILGFFLNLTSSGGIDSIPFTFPQLVGYILVLLASIFFCTSSALFFSLFTKSTIQSMTCTYALILLLYLGPVLAYFVLDTLHHQNQETLEQYQCILTLSPIGTLLFIKNVDLNYFSLLKKSKELVLSNLTLTDFFYIFFNPCFLFLLSLILLLLMQRFFYKFAQQNESR